MHVVALNWRDLKNPRAGGAEAHLEEILRYLARRGHRCTLLTSRFRGGPRDEEVDGYRIVRGGHEYDFNLVARGYPADRITVVHCGIDRDVYRPEPGVPKGDTPTLVYVGRIKRYKSLGHALHALRLVRQRVPGCSLTIVGNGDAVPELKSLASRLGLDQAVRFTGYVSNAEKVRLLRQAHVAVNPSYREGWGLTNVEANACGTVCVAADSPGLRDSVLPGRTGLLYPYGDVPALAERLVRLLTDAGLRARMEREALAWAARLTWEQCGAETRALLERVAGADARAAAVH